MKLRDAAATMMLGALFVLGCAARKAPEPSTAGAPGAPSEDAPRHLDYAPAQQPQAAPPPPPATAAEPSTDSIKPTGRSLALSQAGTEVESSQRELDVAGGDCRNACRALGSMDRAAGRLCGLAQSNDEQRRCGDAKTRVYSARDKVRNTCGTCPDITVERTAPIPSK